MEKMNIILRVLGILLIAVSLLLVFVIPIAGIIGIILGVLSLIKSAPKLIEMITVRLATVEEKAKKEAEIISQKQEEYKRKQSGLENRIFNAKAESEDIAGNLAGNFSMKIDDVFTIPGVGTVVAGKIAGGNIKLGEEIIINANQTITAKVISIETFSKTLTAAEAGDEVGLLLDKINQRKVKRGCIVTKAASSVKL